ncbi:MAG: hypothetical protein U0Y10_03920 [Spirosomataceae bacterium]
MRRFILLYGLSIGLAVAQAPASKQLIVGSGGGFSGTGKEYILLENGTLYRRETPKDTTYKVRVLFRSTAKKYFDKLAKLNVSKRKFNHPGNMSYYVTDHVSDKKSYTVTWGSAVPPKDIKAFYDDFMRNLVPK